MNLTKNNKKNVKEKVNNKLIIRYINIQGLTDNKYYELKQFLKSGNEILILTETHLKCNKFLSDPEVKAIYKIRGKKDKKGWRNRYSNEQENKQHRVRRR